MINKELLELKIYTIESINEDGTFSDNILSDSFLEEFKQFIDWDKVVLLTVLDARIITEYSDYMDKDLLFICQNFILENDYPIIMDR